MRCLSALLLAILAATIDRSLAVSLQTVSTADLVERLETVLSLVAADGGQGSHHNELTVSAAADKEEGRRLSSPFCGADTGTSFTDLLDAAQFAFKRKDYRSSRACYGKALAKYWQDYDTTLRPGLLKATEENMERMRSDTRRLKSAIERITSGPSGSQGLGGGGAAHGHVLTEQERKDAADLRERERQHHFAGKHQAPPGAVPREAAASSSTTTSSSATTTTMLLELEGGSAASTASNAEALLTAITRELAARQALAQTSDQHKDRQQQQHRQQVLQA
jgi:hypothetical protein